MVVRLPNPGQDNGVWGALLNDFLLVEHNADGSLKKTNSIVQAQQDAAQAINLATQASTDASQALTTATQAASATIADGSVTKIKLAAGVQASLDKADSALQTAPVASVAGKTGAVVLAKNDVGLSNVDNTSDTAKNSATATLTNKTISGANNTLTNIPESAITNLTTTLAAKADTTSLATVATSGNYTDLTGRPVLATVAVSGSYTDLTDKPTIPSAPVTSVNSQTGVVNLAKADVGLGNVDNTSDATKNSATATLTNKTISGANNTLTSIPASAVTNLVTDLSAKANLANIQAVIYYDSGTGWPARPNALECRWVSTGVDPTSNPSFVPVYDVWENRP